MSAVTSTVRIAMRQIFGNKRTKFENLHDSQLQNNTITEDNTKRGDETVISACAGEKRCKNAKRGAARAGRLEIRKLR